jgi:hypothetical protein
MLFLHLTAQEVTIDGTWQEGDHQLQFYAPGVMAAQKNRTRCIGARGCIRSGPRASHADSDTGDYSICGP